VVITSDAPSCWSNAGKPSVWVYRNSTAAGAAGGALGALWSPGFTGGTATTADMRLLLHLRSIIVADRADAALLVEHRIAAVVGQVQVKLFVRLPLAVALDDDGDRLGRLAGCEGQRPGPGDVVVVARRRGAVHGLERHGHRLVVGGRERDRERE